MNIRVLNLLLPVLSLLILSAPAIAETRYIVDQIVVNLRENADNQSATIKNLRTGTPLEILEEDSSYVKVRISSGEEGYIKKQYVTSEIPSPIIIARLEKEQDRLNKELAQLEQAKKSQLELKNSAEDELAKMDALLAQTKLELKLLTDKYEDLRFKSEHIVQLAEEKELLDAEHSKLSAEVLELRKENEGFLRSKAIRWFLAGGGVFLFGWIIGKISRKNRRDGLYR